MLAWLEKFGNPLKPYICDTCSYLNEAANNGKNIMFEAQLGALRDIDFGIYPYTSSSSVITAYAPVGAGIPNRKVDRSIGIMKAYSTCVGEGPFTVEMFGQEAEDLRKAGGEYGAATGRPRRVGGFDVVASRYGVFAQGADEIALTKLDILSYMKKIPVCVAYDVEGVRWDSFPTGEALNKAKPIYEYLEGWNCDISGCRKVEDLPKAAYDYIKYIEKAVGCKITYVSVGADREAYIKMS
jgi:adenylosuccinate synthase